jgi:hypothetical protein
MDVNTWEYKKIALGEAPRKQDDIDLLCNAGEEGWELVAILANGIAYLKRQIMHENRERPEPGRDHLLSSDEPVGNGVVATVSRGSEVKEKYRDSVTGETWSGRGRMASWLKRKQDAGEDIEKYRV